MPSVFAYSDYRAFMRDAFAEKKACSRFSWREFAKRAGYASPVFLKLVSDGKSSLSDDGVERVGLALGLTDSEQQFFRILVKFTDEKSAAKKQKLLTEMLRISESCKAEVLGAGQFDYYREWYHSALRELAPRVANEKELVKLLQFKVPFAQIKASLLLLQKLGLLIKDKHGRYHQTNKHLSSGSNIVSVAVRKHHSNMAALAATAIDEIDKEFRDVSGLTMGLSEEGFNELCAELANFRRKVKEIAEKNKNDEEAVYRLNLQLFPLSKPVKGV